MNKARETQLEVIDYLVDRKFKSAGDVPFPSLEQWLEWRERRGATLEPFFEDQATYKVELEQRSLPALNKLLATTMKKEAIHQRQRAELEDQARFFNEESARADFDYWSKMSRWTLDEATALSKTRRSNQKRTALRAIAQQTKVNSSKKTTDHTSAGSEQRS